MVVFMRFTSLKFHYFYCNTVFCNVINLYNFFRISTNCPIDNEPIENYQVFKDKHAQREIMQLACYCNNKQNGCPWQGDVMEVQVCFCIVYSALSVK